MTSPSDSHSEPTGAYSDSALANQPNWKWLQGRLPESGLTALTAWMVGQLSELETDYDHLATPNSRSRYQRQQFAQEGRGGANQSE